MLAVHNSNTGFHPRWRAYCEANTIPYKLVNCYANDIIAQLSDCNALLWHHHQGNPKDILIAKQILFALEHTGFKVFPDFRTTWHFDDKVGQKYLLERIDAPMVPSNVFFDKEEALQWVAQTDFPKVFKLRGGAGSANVKLVKSLQQAKKRINKAFGSGFSNYQGWDNLMEQWRKYRLGKAKAWEVVKGWIRLIHPPAYSKVAGRESGYVYFQDFIPGNDSDTRIIVIGEKAFGLKRYVREGDFRASGSGSFGYSRELFDERCVAIAFQVTTQLKLQVGVFDFVFNRENEPLIVEISYGYTAPPYDHCPGYWDKDLQWHDGKFDHVGWMIEGVIG